MSNSITEQEKSIAVGKPREIRVVEDHGPLAYIWDTARFEQMFRIAEAMALAPIIPDHLRGIKRGNNLEEFTHQQIKGNCFRVVNQAMRWGIDPFAIVDETYVAGGKLAYQGKVVAAIVNARAPLKNRLTYSYSGTKGKDDYEITVSGTFLGEDVPRTVTLSVGQAKTQNQMWVKDPEQKLVYSGAIRWARRYTPELMLGVITEDDIDRMDSLRMDAAKKANAKETRKVEMPDFGATKPAPVETTELSTEHDEVAAPEKSQRKPRIPAKPKATSQEPAPDLVEESPQDRLRAALRECNYDWADFLAGLKTTEFPGVASDVEVIEELSEETCKAILTAGVEKLMADIRDARWMRGLK